MNEAREQEEADVFDPVRCNVAFGSAHDGWAFRLDQFSAMYAEKMGARTEALTRALWGDFAFSAKDKRVVRLRRGGADSKAKPMFVQFILEAVWKAYSVCSQGGGDVAGVLGQICKARGLGHLVPARALE
ncbi:Tr-type G domain-containing protein, partial [Haematococcus lacustris]